MLGGRVRIGLQFALAFLLGATLPYAGNLLASFGSDMLFLSRGGTGEMAMLFACWAIALFVSAWLAAKFSRPYVSATAAVATLGGLSALVAPFVWYDLPLGSGAFALTWPFALVLVTIWPATIIALSVGRRG